MLELVSRHLRSIDTPKLEVIEASDGDEAWKLARERLPDLVVLDVMMPGMSGWEVCRKIRQDASLAHTGVLMLTGHRREPQRDHEPALRGRRVHRQAVRLREARREDRPRPREASGPTRSSPSPRRQRGGRAGEGCGVRALEEQAARQEGQAGSSSKSQPEAQAIARTRKDTRPWLRRKVPRRARRRQRRARRRGRRSKFPALVAFARGLMSEARDHTLSMSGLLRGSGIEPVHRRFLAARCGPR